MSVLQGVQTNVKAVADFVDQGQQQLDRDKRAFNQQYSNTTAVGGGPGQFRRSMACTSCLLTHCYAGVVGGGGGGGGRNDLFGGGPVSDALLDALAESIIAESEGSKDAATTAGAPGGTAAQPFFNDAHLSSRLQAAQNAPGGGFAPTGRLPQNAAFIGGGAQPQQQQQQQQQQRPVQQAGIPQQPVRQAGIPMQQQQQPVHRAGVPMQQAQAPQQGPRPPQQVSVPPMNKPPGPEDPN